MIVKRYPFHTQIWHLLWSMETTSWKSNVAKSVLVSINVIHNY